MPERVDPDKMVTSQEAEAPSDPAAGHDTDRDFMLRYAGGPRKPERRQVGSGYRETIAPRFLDSLLGREDSANTG